MTGKKILLLEPHSDYSTIYLFGQLKSDLELRGFSVYFLFWNLSDCLRYSTAVDGVLFQKINVGVDRLEELYLVDGDVSSISCDVKGELTKYVKKAIDDIQPNYIGLWNDNRRYCKFISSFCEDENVTPIYFEQGLFPNTLSVNLAGVNAGSDIGRNRRLLHHGSLHFIEQFIGDILRSELSVINGCKRKEDVHLDNMKLLNAKGKVVFFPLQIDTDSNILLYSRKFKRMRDVVVELVKALERFSGFELFVRIHPRDNNFSEIESWLKALGVPTLNDMSVSDCLGAADYVVVLNSTVGLEALIRQKKVFALADSVYSGKGVTFDLRVNGDDFSAQFEYFLYSYSGPCKASVLKCVDELLRGYIYLPQFYGGSISKEQFLGLDSVRSDFFSNTFNAHSLGKAGALLGSEDGIGFVEVGQDEKTENEHCIRILMQAPACNRADLKKIKNFLELNVKTNEAIHGDFYYVSSRCFRRVYVSSFKAYGPKMIPIFYSFKYKNVSVFGELWLHFGLTLLWLKSLL